MYLDGELSPSLTAEVHAHLLQCPACQQQFEMMRACSDLISNDDNEPMLDSGFASRVVASLPKRSPQPVLMTRRDARRRFFRIFAGAGLPAAAALLFLSVLIWPTNPTGPHGVVLDANATRSKQPENVTPVNGLVSPAIDAFNDTRTAIRGMSEAVTASMDNANLPEAKGASTTSQPSLLDAFLSPFKDALTPRPAETDKPDEEIVRF